MFRSATSLLVLIVLSAPPACSDGGDAGASDTAVPDTAAPDTSAAGQDTTLPPGPATLNAGALVTVGHIIDGDTLDVRIGSSSYTVRLVGINAPECLKGQIRTDFGDFRFACKQDDEFYGVASYEGLKALAARASAVISCENRSPGQICPKDDFDRYLAYLEIDGEDLSTQAAWHGYAFSFTTFPSSKRAEICAAEYDARDAKRGMWSAGSIQQVLAGMNADTRDWYNRWHDRDCDAALGR